ncbi:MAG: aldo/keto reductase [Gemmobacter sp.]|jgi:aryl-alcohol dehydrogenase-like predicted oxidoreductase|nr:aldo/keto reductase [Gemmobacter sp.]
MKQVPLGQTGISVSELCLGTMTWGTQNSEAEANAQMDLALERGVNFWDTAEMYPTNPVRAETAGGTETIIGNRLAKGGRDRVVLATKVTGLGQTIRPGQRVTGVAFTTALDASLQRLRTDYIDLYQLHWPDRGSYHFRQIWDYRPPHDRAAALAAMEEVLHAAEAAVAAGKIRAIGLSNETVWGAAQWLRLANEARLPRMMTIQNEYSLLCRQFDSDWAELSVMEDMTLLAYSPLACGLLSGKYAGDVIPEGTRRERTPDLGGRITPHVFPAVSVYLGLAREYGLDPCQMALAFTRRRPFPCIPIIGATRIEQLQANIAAADLALSDEVLAQIDALHREHPMPY